MRARHSRLHSRRARRRTEEQNLGEHEAAFANAQPERLGPLYTAGPVHELPPRAATEAAAQDGQEKTAAIGAASAQMEEPVSAASGAARQPQEPGAPASTPPSYQEQLPALEGQGAPTHAVAFNRRGPLRLRGRTDAAYDGGRFHTQNVTARPATDCTGCSGRRCVHVTGTLEATYSVATTVTLPRVSDFTGLTPCQQRRVQEAIDTVLAPHEQEHVRAFQQYNGTTRRAFDLTLCRSEFDGAIQRMFEAEEQARRAAAQAASDALDPFHFDVDLDCEEPRASAEGPPVPAAAAVPPPGAPEAAPA